MSLPNLITFGRILAIPLFLYLLLSNFLILAAIVFVVLAMTDALDGFLARSLGQTTDLGKFLDPIADKVLVISALIALVSLNLASPIPVIIIAARDLAVSGIRMSSAAKGKIISAGFWGKLKTVIQIIAILMLILDVPGANLVLWAALLLTILSGGLYFARK